MKSFLTYALMVGLPTAGVLGILHVGRGLRAPHAVGGEWRIDAGPLAGSALVVEQSGEHVSVILPLKPERRLRGKLRGESLELAHAGTRITHMSACGAERGTTLRASVDASRMTGAVTVGGAGCPSIPIEATRAPKPAARGGH